MLYAYDPTDGSIAAKAAFPDSAGMSDAFCSDRHGHLFTANSDCGGTSAVWMYTAATDTWSQIPGLPRAHGCEASCTVTTDGWLYFGYEGYISRIKL